MITVKTTTAPASLPVSLTDVKTFLRVDGTDDDASITAMIEAATNIVEGFLRRSLVTQTKTLYATGYKNVPLVQPPVVSITSVHRILEDGTEVEITSYTPHLNVEPCYIELNDTEDEVKVVYETGYGAASDVPAAIKQEVMNIVLPMYERRGSDYQKEVNSALHRISNYRIQRVD